MNENQKENSSTSERPKRDGILSKISDKLKKIKHLDIILTVLFIAIILLIYFSSTGLFSAKSSDKTTTSTVATSSTIDDYISDLSTNLENLISNMSGVENAKVMLYYDEDIAYNIAYTLETKTTTSGEKIETKSPVLIDNGEGEKPIVLSKTLPSPKSIIVVASGAENTTVKLEILRLIQAMFEISSSKIEIFAGK